MIEQDRRRAVYHGRSPGGGPGASNLRDGGGIALEPPDLRLSTR
jgi:hypothetical protein